MLDYPPEKLQPSIFARETVLQAIETGRIDEIQQTTEQQLAEAGAELSVFRHTKKQKATYETALTENLDLLSVVAESHTEVLVADGATESQVSDSIVTMLTTSKRSVLEADTDYRLRNYRYERLKERIADGVVTRYAGILASAATFGGLLYLASRGFETRTKRHNYLVVGSAVGAQAGMRALGQRLTNHSRQQLDEYVPTRTDKTNGQEQPEKEQLQRHVDHVTATESELHKIATKHFAANPGDYQGLTPKLIDGLRKWYAEYYRQPTIKDRIETLAIGCFTLTCLGIVIASGESSS